MTAAGIDFGTTNSVVAQWNGEDVEVLKLGGHGLDADWFRPGFDELFPSVVGTSSLREGALFGWEAKLRSEEAVEACKRLLRDESLVTIGGSRFAAATAAAGVFRSMARAAEDYAATTLDSAVITVPANAPGGARLRTRKAARFAGVKPRMLLNEPTAAAVSYAHDMGQDGQFLVFDWGGGTMDATVLLHRDGFFDEKASRGVAKLGGLEIDRRLREMVLARASKRREWTPAETRKFGLDIERAKIQLSSQRDVLILTPEREGVRIGQGEFEDAIQDLITRALDPVQQCLDDLRMDVDELTGVLMIGGCSQIPAVREEVAAALDCAVVGADLCDPMTSVARGAAITAAIMDGAIEGTRHVQVVNSHALGTAVTDKRGGHRRFSEVIRRHQPLPQKESKTYQPLGTNPTLRVEVWEGDPDKPLDHPDQVELTTLTLSRPGRELREDDVFRLHYTYDANGLLHVKATMENTGEVVLDEQVDSFGMDGAPENVREELERLLKLAGTRPGTGVRKPTRWTRPVERPATARPPSRPSPALLAAGPGRPADDPVGTRPLVVDGSNLAWLGRPDRASGGVPSFRQLSQGVSALQGKYPDRDLHVVIDATLRHDVDAGERAEVEAAINDGTVTQPPAGTEGRGDALVVAMAEEMGGTVVSNDNFAPLQRANPWLRDSGRVLGATVSRGTWVFLYRVPPKPRSAR
ncbi:Hsp70 family protein [Streptomyces xiamenensis]